MVEHNFTPGEPAFYLNRELSELAYQRRVLHEARDERNPLLERAKFMAFFMKNMDEFFMKRVGGLAQQVDAGVTKTSIDGRTPHEQLSAIHATAAAMYDEQTTALEKELLPQLAMDGLEIVPIAELAAQHRHRLRIWFEETVLPTLTPLTVGPTHPFPFISNLSMSLGVFGRVAGSPEPTFTRVKVPPGLPSVVPVTGPSYVLLQDLIAANVDLVMPGVDVIEVAAFRLTRNAEVQREEEVAEDLIEMIEEVIELRRFAETVRLEVDASMSERMLDVLVDGLDVRAEQVYRSSMLLDADVLFELYAMDRPDLKLAEWTPRPHPRLGTPGNGRDVFAEIRRGDILLHHPYHSFDDTIQRFLSAAANDPDVMAIKAAIYRTASESHIMETLIDAANEGKQVAVMVELKARFDEEANVEWVRQLEEHGIHVAYGKLGLKTHTKAALVVRREDDGVRLYSHVGTGNYHSGTARTYVDLGILTADRDIGQDLVRVFNYFTGPALGDEFRKLLIAPVTMRREFVDLIRREVGHRRAGHPARIVVKVNALEDPDMVTELYEAARAGVPIDVIARDICRLRPGLAGVSDTVTVHSIVGRFLEHSRIFFFENGGDPEYYIGSADWMKRNLDRRVEAVTPVEDPALRTELGFILDSMLADNRRRWTMNPDGSYTQVWPDPDEPERDAQAELMKRTTEQEVVVTLNELPR
jgi:polyphosphate kinase